MMSPARIAAEQTMPKLILKKVNHGFQATHGEKFAFGSTPAEAIGFLFIGNSLDFCQDFDVRWDDCPHTLANPLPKFAQDFLKQEKAAKEDICAKIGQFYLEESNGDYKEAAKKITLLDLTDVRVIEGGIEISLGRPGILIGRKGETIDRLQKYLGVNVKIIEKPSVNHLVVPVDYSECLDDFESELWPNETDDDNFVEG